MRHGKTHVSAKIESKLNSRLIMSAKTDSVPKMRNRPIPKPLLRGQVKLKRSSKDGKLSLDTKELREKMSKEKEQFRRNFPGIKPPEGLFPGAESIANNTPASADKTSDYTIDWAEIMADFDREPFPEDDDNLFSR